MEEVVSKSEFARRYGCSPAYVTKLDRQGRLVKNKKGQVLLDASKKRIEATGEITKAKAPPIDEMDYHDDLPHETAPNKILGVTHRFQSSRADKEDAAAKLARLKYEKEMGDLVYKDDVAKHLGDAIKIARDKLLALPAKLAPRVTVEKDLKNNYAIIEKEINDVITEIQQGLARFGS